VGEDSERMLAGHVEVDLEDVEAGRNRAWSRHVEFVFDQVGGGLGGFGLSYLVRRVCFLRGGGRGRERGEEQGRGEGDSHDPCLFRVP
jgi:hypothetical protein